MCDTPSPEEEKNRITYHTFRNDYVCSSKKQRKRQKQLDANLAAAMSASLSTSDLNVLPKDVGNPPTLSSGSKIKKKKSKKLKKSTKEAIKNEILQNQSIEKELHFNRSQFRESKEFDSANEWEDNSNSKIDTDNDEPLEFESSECAEKVAKEKRLMGLPKKFGKKGKLSKKSKKNFKNKKNKSKKRFLKKLQGCVNLNE